MADVITPLVERELRHLGSRLARLEAERSELQDQIDAIDEERKTIAARLTSLKEWQATRGRY